MISALPTVSELDALIQRAESEPDSPNRAAALATLRDQRTALVPSETATGEVGEILRKLESGALSTDEAVRRLAAMDWSTSDAGYLMLADSEDDPAPMGPFGAVESAFVDGRITHEQYTAIVAAISTATTNL